MSDDCIFCKIVSGAIPAEIIAQNEHAIVIKDIHPQAPTHLLVIPRMHIVSLAECTPEHTLVLGECLRLGQSVMKQRGLTGYRTIVNTGKAGGQTVMHLHFHFLGGKTLSEAMT